MNQHKDLLYRQTYATYKLNNRTFSTQNTKISARSLAISYICFQVRIVKKIKGGGGSHTITTTTENLVTPAPPTPDKGSIREIATGEITLPITPDDHLEGPYLLKTRELPGALPPGPPAGALTLHPARAPTAGPWTPPVWGARFAHTWCATRTDFSAHPFFCVQILDPPLYTFPLARPSRLPPEASILGELGSSRPPPPNDFFFFFLGGANISFCPPPIISSTWKIDNM